MNRNLQKAFDKLKRNTNLSKAVKLGLVDELDYSFDSLQDEVGRLAYSTEEWYEEKFEDYYEARSVLRDVYFNNSEVFITPDDVLEDMQRLIDMKVKADELGVDINDIYPDYDDHKQLIEDLDYFQKRFEDQQFELEGSGFQGLRR